MSKQHSPKDIAIIGMAGLFPGAKDLGAFWRNIVNRVDSIAEATDDWIGPFYDPASSEIDRIYTKKGGFLDELSDFNPLDFGIMPNAIDGGQPDQFLALKIARDALIDAGYLDRPFNREKCGVIIGHGATLHRGSGSVVEHGLMMDQVLDLIRQFFPTIDDPTLKAIRQEFKRHLPPFNAEILPALVPNILAGRIANRLDLMGPNFIVDAACASSMIALEMSIKELLSGRCDMVITGAVHASIPPQVYMLFCEINALSHTDVRPFDKLANGTLLGEGLGLIVLKRLADAERDDDRIYAVIKGLGSSSDGKALGLFAPRLEGEILALQRAYSENQIDPKTISLVEAHGTGIPLGDRTEINCLTNIFGTRDAALPRIALGSIKSMVGHCLTAAGIAGLIKTALAIYHKVYPPTLCGEVSPELKLEETPFYISTVARPWIHSDEKLPRRAGVNAFGFGGANTHAILEEYVGVKKAEPISLYNVWQSEMFLFSGKDRAELIHILDRIIELLQDSDSIILSSLAKALGFRQDLQDSQVFDRIDKIGKNVSDRINKINNTDFPPLSPPLEGGILSTPPIHGGILSTPPVHGGIKGGSQGEIENSLSHEPKTQSLKPDYRLAIIASNLEDLKEKLHYAKSELSKQNQEPSFKPHKGFHYAESRREGKIAFLISGQGSQYPNMLADLCIHFPKVRAWFDFLDETFCERDRLPSSYLYPPPTVITEEERAQLAREIFDIEVGTDLAAMAGMAMYELLRDFQIPCDFMVGHSTGEHTALFTSETVRFASREQHKEIMRYFNRLFHQSMENGLLPEKGVLLSIGACEIGIVEKLVEESLGQLYFCLDNCPNQVVIFGSEEAIAKVKPRLEEAGGICERMPFSEPYHTPLYEKAAARGVDIYDTLEIKTGYCTLYSCVTTKPFPENREAIAKLAVKHHSHRVRFRETILNMYEDGARIFIEVGPSGNLTAFVQDILYGKDFLALPSNVQHKSGIEQLQFLLAQLFVNGVPVDTSTLYRYREVPDLAPDSRLPASGKELNTEKSVPHHGKIPKKKKPIQRLKLNMPVMKLSEEFIESIREKISITGAQSPEPKAKSPTPDVQSLKPKIQSPTTDPRLAALTAHFDLMNEFLASQARVMSGFPDMLTDKQSLPPAAQSRKPEAQSLEPEASFEQSYPLLGEIIEREPDRLYAERRYEIEQDIFLEDHSLGGAPSSRNPQLHSIAVLPFTFSMETISEAAVCLISSVGVPACGKKTVIRIEEIRAHRWLALDRGYLDLGIEVKLIDLGDDGTHRVLGRIYQLSDEQNDPRRTRNKTLGFEGVVILQDGYPSPPTPRALRLTNPQPSHYTTDTLYSNGIPRDSRYPGEFHGPRFHGLKNILRTGDEGLVAEAVVMPRDKLFKHISDPHFQTDPILVDIGGQLASFWVSERFAVDLNIFPFRMKAFHFYEKPLPPGTKLTVNTFMRFADLNAPDSIPEPYFEFLAEDGNVINRLYINKQKSEENLTSDPQSLKPDARSLTPESRFDYPDPNIYYQTCLQPQRVVTELISEYLDESGKVIAIMEGWQCRYFSIPHAHCQVSLYPQYKYLSAPWMQKESGLIIRRIIPPPVPFMEESWGIWKRKGAHLTLTMPEQDSWYNIPETGARRLEWLMGRIAAKDVLRQWMQEKLKENLAPADFEIRTTETGKPYAVSPSMGFIPMPDISISHSEGYAVAAVAPMEKNIGLDVQILSAVNPDSLLVSGFTDQEKKLIDESGNRLQASGDRLQGRDRAVIALWSAKEAVVKAIGSGLEGDPKQWVVESIDLKAGNVVIKHEGNSYDCRIWVTNREVLAVCLIDKG